MYVVGNHYINNKVFEGLIKTYRRQKKGKDKVAFKEAEDALTKAFYLLVGNLIHAFKTTAIDRDDMLQEGVWLCYEKLHKFNSKKGKAFNYYTTCILNHFRQLYRAQNHFHKVRLNYFNSLYESDKERLY